MKGERKPPSKIIGFLFLLSFFVPIFNWIFILANFTEIYDAEYLIFMVIAYDGLFRINIYMEIISSILIVALGVSLYSVLNSSHKKLSLFGLIFKMFESLLAVLIAVTHIMILYVLTGESFHAISNSDYITYISSIILQKHIYLTAVSGIFMGLSFVFFFWGFYLSDLLPKKLSIFGIVTFILTFFYDSLYIVDESFAQNTIVQAISTIPLVIFQLLIGFWLLTKGFKLKKS